MSATDLEMAYHMGYDDALAKRKPDASKVLMLGRGMLTADDVRDLIELHSDASGGNGRVFHNGAYVAIADELNVTLGAGTCRAVYKPTGVVCSECGGGGLTIPVHGVNALRNFCPNCGRKVVDG